MKAWEWEFLPDQKNKVRAEGESRRKWKVGKREEEGEVVGENGRTQIWG